MQLRETIRDVKALHNENLVAVAQKKYVYIYDNQGAEVGKAKANNHRASRAGAFALANARDFCACAALDLAVRCPRGGTSRDCLSGVCPVL